MTETAEYDHVVIGGGQKYFKYPPKIIEVDGFEEGLPEICLKKIRKLLLRCKQLRTSRAAGVEQLRQLKKPGSLEELWVKTWAASEYSEYYYIQRWLNHWTKLWRLATNQPLPKKVSRYLNQIDEADIERAKQADIEPHYEGKLRRFGNKLMGLCPWHEEKTASFCIYPEGRGYYCFGCGVHGTAIDFVMKTKGLTFPEATRSLL